jgi:hypothetical protein
MLFELTSARNRMARHATYFTSPMSVRRWPKRNESGAVTVGLGHLLDHLEMFLFIPDLLSSVQYY